ncbi:hypothetical protein Tco_1488253 [Tanacetum coccineum]
MANLEFCDTHNMVAYLKKPTGSERFQDIVDFLNDSHIREHTPLFPSMLALQAKEGEGSGNPSEPQLPPSTAQPTHEEPIPNIESSSPQKTQLPRQALTRTLSYLRLVCLYPMYQMRLSIRRGVTVWKGLLLLLQA